MLCKPSLKIGLSRPKTIAVTNGNHHIRQRLSQKFTFDGHTWKSIWDWKKMFASPIQKSAESPLTRVPPRQRQCPSGAIRAAPEKEAKMTPARAKALGRMVGLIRMARSSRGPELRPETNANPIKKRMDNYYNIQYRQWNETVSKKYRDKKLSLFS